MKEGAHAVIIVPDGVGVKNYLYSNVLKHLSKDAKITIWSTLPESTFTDVKTRHQIEFNYEPLSLQAEGKRTRLFREAATYARLRYNTKVTNNATIMKNWRLQKQNLKLHLLYQLAEYMGAWASHSYKRILKLERLAKKYWSKPVIAVYKKQLEKMQPTSLFITHQRVAGLMPVCLAAKEQNIKTSTAVFSWDNLPKARLNVDVDDYLVWSDWMKDEMQLYYKEIDIDRVKVTGTPQFEFYKDETVVINRDKFAETYGLNPELKWVCFSGDDELTSPHDPLYLRDVAAHIKKNKLPLQIIFRRCPVDFSNRYDAILEEYHSIIVSIDPIWYTEAEAWVGYYSKQEDIALQVNLAKHCEAVINLGSTMAIDFATFNKPCLYINYDAVNDENWTTEFIYKFQHFRSMEGMEPVGWINNEQEITDKLSALLEGNIGRDRTLWLEKLVRHPYETNSELIAKTIL